MTSDIQELLLSRLDNLSQGEFAVGIDFIGRHPHYTETTYPDAFTIHYIQNQYMLTDPTITFGKAHAGHVTWAELARMYPDQPNLEAAARFGMTQGNTLSIHVNGKASIVSATGAPWTAAQVAEARAALFGLHSLRARGLEAEPAPVSQAVIEVLQLMRRGLRDLDIADDLQIKVETVRQRRSRAYNATDTTTPAGVVGAAIDKGWI